MKITFVSNRDGNTEIYVMNADGTDQTRLTTNLTIDIGPLWSPDGTKIAFISDREGSRQIYVMNADGTNQTQLTVNLGGSYFVWSPDGTKIAFTDINSAIYVKSVDGTQDLLFTRSGFLPVWSPDGTKLAFRADPGIGVVNADGTNAVSLSSSGEDHPVWSPDGTKIAFESVRDGNSEIYVMNADGTNQTRLTTNLARDDGPAWSPFLPTPVIALSTMSLDFGDVLVGSSGQQTFEISNTGTGTLTISGLSHNPGQYALPNAPSVPFDIAPGHSDTLTVDFAPTLVGTAADTIRIVSNDPTNPTVLVMLSGRGVDAVLSLSTPSLDFGDNLVGSSSERGFRISNTGTAALVMTSIADNSDQFDSSPAVPPDRTIFPDQFEIISVTFNPTAAGIDSTLLTMTSHAEVLAKRTGPPPTAHVSLKGKALIPGDLTRDTQVNILDIIALIRLILGQDSTPEAGSLSFVLADVNQDGDLNILDIVRQVNLILGIPKPLADGPKAPVTVSLGDIQTLASEQLAIPVTVKTDGMIAGAQAVFTFDATQLQVGAPRLVGRANGMTLQSQVTGGTLRLLVYSATGNGIASGSGTTLLVLVTVLGGQEASTTLTLSQVILANHQAQRVPVTMGTSTVKVSALPTAFALKPNRPNPFNPTTSIAYDVPQAAHITLAVYNLLGQEVVRLVDAQQAPGRYVVTWNGRNGQRLSVASGVYVYRLTTSTGFTQSRRMTLLK